MVYTSPWLSFIVGTSVLIMPSWAWSKESVCKRQAGIISCKQGSVPQIQASGIVDVEETTVEGACNIRGQYAIKKATLKAVNLYGNGSIRETHVTGKARVFGNLVAVASSFEQQCDIWSNTLNLEKVKMKNLHIHNNQSSEAVVILGQGTIIDGNLVFEDSPGIVKLHNQAQIKGEIINGSTVNI